MNRWRETCASVCAGLGMGLACLGTSWAEPSPAVTVVAQGQAPFQKDLSLDEVRGRARDQARRNAVEQAVGVFVRGTTVVHNSQIADELVTAVARGVIEEEQWVEERIEEVKGDKQAGPVQAVYRVRLKALVRPVHVERRAGFELEASLNKQVFQQGEEAVVKVRSSQPAYLNLFSITQDGTVTLLLPNRFVKQNLVSAEQELTFPNEALRLMGVRLRVVLPKGARKAVEYIKVIATSRPVILLKGRRDKSSGSPFATYDGNDAGMIQDVVKNLALLEDEEWTEATVPYEVRQ